MALTHHLAPTCRAHPASRVVADADLAEAWQALADVAPRYPHAHPTSDEMDALAWRELLCGLESWA